MKTTLILLSLLAISFGLYEHHVGQNDWHIKTFGQLKDIQIESKNIYFLNQQNLFGSISTETGDVLRSQGRQKQGAFLWNKQIQDQRNKFQALYSTQSTLQIYNFQSNSFVDISTNELETQQIISYVYLKKDKVVLLTETSLYITESTDTDLQLKEIASVESTERFAQLSYQDNQLYIVGYEQSQICLFNVDSLKSNSNLKRQCVNLVSKNFDQSKLVVAQEYIFYRSGTPVIFDLKSGKQVKSAHKNLEAIPNQNLLQQNGDFFRVQNSELKKVFSAKESKNIIPVEVNDPDTNVYYYVELSNTGFADLYQFSNGQVSRVFTWPQKSAINKIWVKAIGSNVVLLVQNQDLQTNYYSSKIQDSLWSREESLAYIKDLKFIDYTHAIERHVSSYHELLDEKGSFNTLYLVPQLVLRIKDELQDLVLGLISFADYAKDIVQGLVQARSLQDLKDLNQIGVENSQYNIFYGIKKIVLAVSKQNTLFRLESDSGEIVWRVSINELIDSSYELLGIYDLEEREEDVIHNEVVLVYHSQSEKSLKIFQVQPSNGDVKLVQSFEIAKNPSKILKIQKEFNEHLIVLDDQFKGHVYPTPKQQDVLKDISDNIIFYSHDKQTNNIQGYRFFQNKVEQIWNINFAEQEVIIQIESSYAEGNNPKLALFDDKKVILKHIDYTNFAVITKNKGKGIYQGDGILNLYIVNAKTGRILFNHNQQLVDLSQPINMVYDENSVFVSYFNPEKFLYELWVVEAYSKDMITSFVEIIEDNYISPKHQDETFNYVDQDMNIIFLEQKYGFPKGIKSLKNTDSKLKLTRKNLVVITQQDQIYSLDRNLVSTRRQNKEVKMHSDLKKVISFESADLPAYAYLIPLNFLQFQSYYLDLNGLVDIQFSPTNFESTSLYIAYGGDIFCSKIAPENSFDILSEDFNYLFLVLTIVVVIYMVIFMKKFADKSLIFKIFHS